MAKACGLVKTIAKPSLHPNHQGEGENALVSAMTGGGEIQHHSSQQGRDENILVVAIIEEGEIHHGHHSTYMGTVNDSSGSGPIPIRHSFCAQAKTTEERVICHAGCHDSTPACKK